MSEEKWKKVVETVNIPRTMHPTMWPFNDAQEGIAWADAELSRLRAAKEAAEAALCRAMEALQSIETDVICLGPNCPYCEDDEGKHPSSGVALRAGAALHSIQNSAPCPHAAEVEALTKERDRLKEAAFESTNVSGWHDGYLDHDNIRHSCDCELCLLLYPNRRRTTP